MLLRTKAIEDILTDEEFWAKMTREMAGKLASVAARTVLRGAASAQSVGVIVDFDAVHQQALDIARNTSSRWWGTMVETTREGLRRTLINYVEMGLGKRGLPDLIENLERWFEPARAKRIAVTETTRLFAEGNKLAGDMDDAIGGYRWQTGRAEHQVCAVCWPRNGKIYPKGQVPDCPAHTSCYCAIIPVSWAYIRQHLSLWQGGPLPPEPEAPEPEPEQATFTPAGNIMELEQWVAINLKTLFGSMKGVELETGNTIVKTVADIERRLGEPIPATIVFEGVKGKAIASYNASDRLVMFRKRYQDVGAQMLRDDEIWRKRFGPDVPFHAVPTMEGVIYHEVAHALDAASGWRFSKAINALPLPVLSNMIKVSGYSGSDISVSSILSGASCRETWAEVFTAVVLNSPRAVYVPEQIVQMIQEIWK